MGLRFGDKFAARANLDEMNTVKENQDDLKWCGSSPIYTFLKAVPQARGTLHRYEQWNIDENSVVSFAGISFAPGPAVLQRTK